MKSSTSIDPLKGVYNSDELVLQLKRLAAGETSGKVNPRSYIKGSLQWLEAHPPNKLIVPILKKALSKYST